MVSDTTVEKVYVMALKATSDDLASEGRQSDIYVHDEKMVMNITRLSIEKQKTAGRFASILDLELETGERDSSFSVGLIYLKNVDRVAKRRKAQKAYMEIKAAEKYLGLAEAFDADNGTNEKKTAGAVIRSRCRSILEYANENCTGFDDAKVKALYSYAFSPRYSYITEDEISDVTDDIFDRLFLNDARFNKSLLKYDGFGRSESVSPAKHGLIKRFFDRIKTLRPKFRKSVSASSDASETVREKDYLIRRNIEKYVSRSSSGRTGFSTDYDAYIKLLLSDIRGSSLRTLSEKRHFAEVDMMHQHKFIFDYHDRMMPASAKNDARERMKYYYNCEKKMFLAIYGHEGIYIKDGYIVYPDGSSQKITKKPHDMLHDVNITIAARKGYNGDDVTEDQLWNSVRAAYTAEGVDDYRIRYIDRIIYGM